MRTIGIALCILLTVGIVNSQTNISGTIAKDSTWTLAKSPYIVTGDVAVNGGFTLTVDSGVVVRFSSGTSLRLYGAMQARHAIFTSRKDTAGGLPAKGDWGMIQCGEWNATPAVTLDTCQVKFGGSSNSGNIYVRNGVVSLRGMIASGSSTNAIYVYAGTLNVSNSILSTANNSGLLFEAGTSIAFANSTISSCDWPVMYNGAASLIFFGVNQFTGNTHNGIYMNFYNTDNIVLDTVSIPYYFPNDCTVNAGKTMTIASGNVLKFIWGHLYVNGALIAIAGPGKTITFTSARDDNAPTPGSDTNNDGTATAPHASDWGGVVFNDQSADSICVLRRVTITFAGSGNTGGVTMYNASPTIDSCSMANNYYGAMMQYVSNPLFVNNVIGSSTVVPIAMSFAANPVFNNNSFSFSDNQYDAIGLLGGNLAATSVLPIRSVTSIQNVTYLMLEDVVVPGGMTLTIQKGIVIKSRFDVNYPPRITVRGKFVAVGTPDSLIVFTSPRDDNYGNPGDVNKDGTQSSPQTGDWGGIVFEGSSDSTSRISYALIKYGRMPWTYYNTRYIYGGAITTVNASPTISNCEIKDVDYGIYAFQASNPKIWNNAIINTQYTPIAMSVSADPLFIGNIFTNTKWTALGIIGEEVGVSGTVKQRTIADITNITYLLLEDLTINSGTNVTVEAGVVIKCKDAGIFVNGGFRAKGNAVAGRVVFTSMKDDNVGHPQDTNGDGNGTSPAPGNWKAIRFQGTSDDAFCLLDSCMIKFGGADADVALGAVTFVDANGSVSNTLISDSYNYGVRCDGGSNPLVTGVEVKNCRLDPLAMSLKSNPTFTNITFISNGTKGIRIVEGTLSSNATLHKRDVAGITNIAYIVETLTISSNAVLTIDPGVVIKFPITYYGNYARIVVNGALIAKGTKTEKIIFTSRNDDSNGGDSNNDGNNSSPSRGDWWDIEFHNSGSDSLNSLKYCEIRYAGSGGGSYEVMKQYGALRVADAHVQVDSCIVQQSGTTGLGVYGSADPVFNTIELYNIEYTPVSMSMFASPTFVNISALNVGIMALGIVPETFSVSAAIPKRDFAGITNIGYYFFTAWYSERPTINSGTTITIPAGVVFKASHGFLGVLVNGGIVIQGTPSQKVVFTDVADDMYGNPGDANGNGSASLPSIDVSNRGWIEMGDVSDDSVSSIANTVFRYREYGIDLLQASPKIRRCLFDKTDWGVRLNGVSQPTLDSCAFNNLTYAPFRTSVVSYPRSSEANTIAGSTYRAIGVLEETLAQDVTLVQRNFGTINNIPYLFGNFTVGTGAIMTVSPGIVMKFFPGKRMTVRKGLIAEGGSTRDSLIVFTDSRDDFYGGDMNADTARSTPNPMGYYDGDWYGIVFEGESLDPFCRLRNCVVRYAGNGWYPEYGGIVANNASPSIMQSLITDNRKGVIANGASNPVINQCDIVDNIEYGIQNANLSFNIDARWNWWGSNTGPTHSGNPGGIGQVVSDSVNYGSFLGTGALNPMMGDVSLNGAIQAFDASLILRWLVDSVGSPLNAIQRRVADVNGVAGISAYDASLILQFVVGKINIFPVKYNSLNPSDQILPKKAMFASAGLSDGTVEHGKQVTVTLSAGGLKDVYSADVEMSYDQKNLKPIGVKSVGIAATASMSESRANGVVHIVLASAEPLASDGALAEVTFEALDGIHGEVKSPVSIAKLQFNESGIKSEVAQSFITIKGKPVKFSLDQNYPNPFNPSTTISYQVPENGQRVKVEIFNVTGQRVRELVNTTQDAGEYRVIWDGVNDGGLKVGSGLYFCRMASGSFVSVKKMLLVK
jgi:hypothetical protein